MNNNSCSEASAASVLSSQKLAEAFGRSMSIFPRISKKVSFTAQVVTPLICCYCTSTIIFAVAIAIATATATATAIAIAIAIANAIANADLSA